MDSELKQYLEAIREDVGKLKDQVGKLDDRVGKLDQRLDQFDNKLVHLNESLIEKMRDMQTELLRGFAAFSEAQTFPSSQS